MIGLKGATDIIVENQPLPIAPSVLTISVIGGLNLAYRGATFALPNRKARALLAYLALEPASSFSRELLAGLFWSGSDDARARSSLRTTLHELRKALLASGCMVLRIGQDEVSLALEQVQTDLDLALEEVESGRVPPQIAAQPRVVDLLLSGYEDLSDEFREWVHRLRSQAHLRLVRALEAGYSNPTLPPRVRRRMAETALALEPLDEAACRMVMQLAAETAEIGVALRAYSALYEALGLELDMEPSEATQALVASIKSGRIEANTQTTDFAQGPAPTRSASAALATAVLPTFTAVAPGIIVLPFRAEPGMAAKVADGVADGIVHVLSGIGELLVIARGTARSYAGRDVDPRQIGRDLGVDCVLSGHVAVHGDTVRVSTELAETASGRVIRSGRYQSTQRGMFALQDQIAEEVVAIAAPAVKAHVLERAKRKPPGSLTAYELMLQGIELQYALDPASFAQSGQRLREAIALDPSYAPSCAHAAFWHMFNVGQGWSADPAEDNRLAGHFASKAIGLDPNNAVAHAVQGHVLGVSSRDYASARQHLDRATLLGPSSVQAWTLSAVSHSWTGKGGLGVEHATHAMRLSPHDPFVFFTEHALSQSHYVLGNHDVAIAMARNVARLKPSLTSNLRTLTASLVAAGQMPAARDMATQILAIQPNFRLAAFAQQTPLDQPVRDIFVERLRLAGLPE